MRSRASELGLAGEAVEVNGEPGALFRDPEGPDKLRHLGVPADTRALIRGRRIPADDDDR